MRLKSATESLAAALRGTLTAWKRLQANQQIHRNDLFDRPHTIKGNQPNDTETTMHTAMDVAKPDENLNPQNVTTYC